MKRLKIKMIDFPIAIQNTEQTSNIGLNLRNKSIEPKTAIQFMNICLVVIPELMSYI